LYFLVTIFSSCSDPVGKIPNSASFLRPSRLVDKPRTFLQALGYKYGNGADPSQEGTESGARGDSKVTAPIAIEVGGKIVEEVGFDRVSRQLAQLDELRIVLLDGTRIAEDPPEDLEDLEGIADHVRSICPKIVELDVGRCLWESWKSVVACCVGLEELRKLRVKYALSRQCMF